MAYVIKSSTRKAGNLLAIAGQELSWQDDISRIVQGPVAVSKINELYQAANEARFPHRHYVQIEIRKYFEFFSPPDTYGWYIKDTHSLSNWRTADSYRRPGHELCTAGHVPVTWLYQSDRGVNLLGVMTGWARDEALSELARIGGQPAEYVEVLVQPVWVKKKKSTPLPPKPPEPKIPLGPLSSSLGENWKGMRPVKVVDRRGGLVEREQRTYVPPPTQERRQQPDDWAKRYIMTWGLIS
jgi:hypothetical protein